MTNYLLIINFFTSFLYKLGSHTHHTLRLRQRSSMRYPIYCVGYSMVDPRLPPTGTAVSSWDDSDEVPSACPFEHQRPSTVSLTAVFAASSVPRAQHFGVDHYIYPCKKTTILFNLDIDGGSIYQEEFLHKER